MAELERSDGRLRKWRTRRQSRPQDRRWTDGGRRSPRESTEGVEGHPRPRIGLSNRRAGVCGTFWSASLPQPVLGLPLFDQVLRYPAPVMPLEESSPVEAEVARAAAPTLADIVAGVSSAAQVAESRSSRGSPPTIGRPHSSISMPRPWQLVKPLGVQHRHGSVGLPRLLAGAQEAAEGGKEASQALPSQRLAHQRSPLRDGAALCIAPAPAAAHNPEMR